MLICLLWFCHRLPKEEIVRTYVFHLLGTYVNILCNWLILWQNAFYLYLGRFRMCLNTSRNHVSRSSVKTFKSVQENKLKVQIYWNSTIDSKAASIEFKKAVSASVLNSFSTPPICQGLRNSEFWCDFLEICECIFGPSLFLTLDI